MFIKKIKLQRLFNELDDTDEMLEESEFEVSFLKTEVELDNEIIEDQHRVINNMREELTDVRLLLLTANNNDETVAGILESIKQQQ